MKKMFDAVVCRVQQGLGAGLTKGSAARECTGNIQGIYREYTGNIKGIYREYTGDIQGVTIQASAAREAATNFSAIFHTYCLVLLDSIALCAESEVRILSTHYCSVCCTEQ